MFNQSTVSTYNRNDFIDTTTLKSILELYGVKKYLFEIHSVELDHFYGSYDVDKIT